MQRPFKPASKRLGGPAFVWSLMTAAGDKGFTVAELEAECSANKRSTVKSYVLAMLAQGYVARLDLDGRKSDGTFGRRRYRVVRKSRQAPVARRDSYTGERGRAREHLWNAMRILPSFGIRELQIAASTDEVEITFANARAYVGDLLAAGLLVALRPYEKSGKGRAPGAVAGLYRLKPAYNAPLPPKAGRDGVFDPNTELLHPYSAQERAAA